MSQKSKTTDRRSFLKTLTTGLASVAGVMAAVVGVGFLYPVPRRKPRPFFICLESDVPTDKPLEILDQQNRKVLIMRNAGGELVAFGTVCPHLGCSVYWRPKENRFDCPCHQGVFDADGQPIAGPPRAPLNRYPLELREGKVFIQFA